MLSIDPKKVSTRTFYNYLVGAVAPRPIAFVSTVDKADNQNVAPFSFFNVFSSNPPILVFSPAFGGPKSKPKDTLENIKEVPEVVINMVNYGMLHQTTLAGVAYEKEVNEFEKAGFTGIPSELVKPLRVKESPVQMECKVLDIVGLGQGPGAGNLVICEVLKMHIHEDVLDENQEIDPIKIDLISRMGGNWFSRSNEGALFEVNKSLMKIGIGIDQIPEYIRNSNILTGNNLGQLGSIEKIPSESEIAEYKLSGALDALFLEYGKEGSSGKNHLHEVAQALLEEHKDIEAWMVLLSV